MRRCRWAQELDSCLANQSWVDRQRLLDLVENLSSIKCSKLREPLDSFVRVLDRMGHWFIRTVPFFANLPTEREALVTPSLMRSYHSCHVGIAGHSIRGRAEPY